eukprot:6006271-Amphidinium_carterae.1
MDASIQISAKDEFVSPPKMMKAGQQMSSEVDVFVLSGTPCWCVSVDDGDVDVVMSNVNSLNPGANCTFATNVKRPPCPETEGAVTAVWFGSGKVEDSKGRRDSWKQVMVMSLMWRMWSMWCSWPGMQKDGASGPSLVVLAFQVMNLMLWKWCSSVLADVARFVTEAVWLAVDWSATGVMDWEASMWKGCAGGTAWFVADVM